nr:immunoglobulin heavy chain junction region [Macaca mulatta]MOX41045.1 immunoglobulin heavy chain junction region [Macaca mulatta]
CTLLSTSSNSPYVW